MNYTDEETEVREQLARNSQLQLRAQERGSHSERGCIDEGAYFSPFRLPGLADWLGPLGCRLGRVGGRLPATVISSTRISSTRTN